MDTDLEKVTKQIEEWWQSERWMYSKRNYGPKDVAVLRHSLDLVTPSHYTSKKLYSLLRGNFDARTSSFTYGALDTV